MAIVWTFVDERTPAVLDVFTRVVANGAFVPGLWPLEVATVLRTALRRGRCDEMFVTRSLSRFRRLAVEIDAETNVHAWGRTRELSIERDLTSYDASYLELAIRRQLVLATTDKALRKAASRCDLEVIG